MKSRDIANEHGCEGKVAFVSFQEATGANERRRRGMHSVRRGIYKCPVCGNWHMGRRDGKRKRSLGGRPILPDVDESGEY
jgi:hypothetical protein